MLLLHVTTLLLVGAGTDKYWRLLQTHLTEGRIQADLGFFLKLVPDVSECLWVFHRGPPVFLFGQWLLNSELFNIIMINLDYMH